MTDFESKLRASLRDHAEEAPGATGLADGARRRLRRRRTSIASAALAAAVVVGAPLVAFDRDPVPSGVASDPTSPAAPDSGTPTQTANGLRTESWHDLTFEVPASWGLGNPSAYCASGATAPDATPTVGRPTDITLKIACNPATGYGVNVGPADLYEPASGDVYQYQAKGLDRPLYPGGAWVSIWYDDEVAITIATPDQALTEQIVRSVRRIDGVDPHGCAPLLGDAEAAVSDGTDTVSVCRYDETDELEWSRGLAGADAAEVRDLVSTAPVQDIDYDCPSEPGPGRFVVLDGGAYTATVVNGASCEGNNAVFLPDAMLQVTPELSAALERPLPAG